ncbi:hypothetical protein FHX42_003525 [Saccharopolyspora lacisalsi]|uniref:Uncharacterized protein n=1 Tax=Halosaccharopolyspora lacisalsi TaxID=1000566 RepID=A0A839DZN2_9PSEU|nr:DUF6098 family protein [Halosaccharopolyspora lacisalsi]MBA8826149.1 hypothetical protein [Halosaccharopolyspora lacisalsi]
MTASNDLPVVGDLDRLAEIVRHDESGLDLYVRWSRGPEWDTGATSRDALTGVELPGLSANPLRVEPWWGDRSLRLWVARRLHDYEHLRRRQQRSNVEAWLLRGHELARGPDNEPLVRCEEALGWIAEETMREARRVVTEQHGDWRPLNREG